MKLVRKISDGNRVAIPIDILKQTYLKEGDNITLDVINIDGYPTILIQNTKTYKEIKGSA